MMTSLLSGLGEQTFKIGATIAPTVFVGMDWNNPDCPHRHGHAPGCQVAAEVGFSLTEETPSPIDYDTFPVQQSWDETN